MSSQSLSKRVYLRIAIAFPVLALLLFLPAGTLNYWQAWVYLGVLFIPMAFVFGWMLQNMPDLLERRMHMKEREPAQKKIILFTFPYFLLAFLLPGLDQRFGWSDVPAWLALAANGLVFLGYMITVAVFRANRYASRVVEVDEQQQVIDSGPYALVRHPMYTGATLMYLASPLALGSYWAMIPALAIIPILVARALNEEQVLSRELAGYKEYMQRVRWRLIPYVW